MTGTSLLCTLLIVVRIVPADRVQYTFLLWNLFLAWLPLLVSMAAIILTRLNKGAELAASLVLCGIAWLLLYPNAPYLTTDLIHLVFNPDYAAYNRDGLLIWYDLVLFFLFSWCGLLLGYLSMRHFHEIVNFYMNPVLGWLFVLSVAFLGGFGIYLGRVIRLNSWDILNPLRLAAGILEGISLRSAVFTVLFGTLILIVYLSLYMLGVSRAPAKDKNRI
ncbi:hypothetical protein SD71_20120 [Cohnella kolymensis]|uniref:DUF1361 domain-containing protein n=1 Tax=Cohnella kolymensis TaxID=1590652 RepID=A0ABR5A082_9BACL|nr:hypothetical protein SD71_20120 [Cohnella kolymensis]